ncbi:hypothetical protein [Pseudoalteromonas sp. PB2-1]|uniref:hypothetical protein n=1 Tax=Pseudoalteromonas sp. PB2-1 TaxID=2907242 RepID=UPI00386589BB
MVKSDSNHYVYDGYNRRIKTVDSKGISYSLYIRLVNCFTEKHRKGALIIYLGGKLVAKEGTGVAAAPSVMNYKPYGDSIEAAKDDVGYTGISSTRI